jgi:hypothetical protein
MLRSKRRVDAALSRATQQFGLIKRDQCKSTCAAAYRLESGRFNSELLWFSLRRGVAIARYQRQLGR